jgi:hypothetical protein
MTWFQPARTPTDPEELCKFGAGQDWEVSKFGAKQVWSQASLESHPVL